jgi:hypothetical protein
MTITDEMLMAFADDQLDAAASAAVESAMRDDPSIAKRIAAHRALRQRIELAYASELAEPLPERLLAAVTRRSSGPGDRVVAIKNARDARSRDTAASRTRRPWWQPAGAIAASAIIGFGLGYSGRNQSPLVRSADGALVAHGQLAQALSLQLSADAADTPAVSIGVSFLSKSGDYCRTFALSGSVSPQGLACHHGREWQILALSQSVGSGAAPKDFRTAGSEMSPLIIKSVEEQIAGEPLDQSGEAEARGKDWKTPD